MHSFYRTLPSDYLGKLSNQLLFITWVGGEGGHMVFRGNGGFVVVNGVLRGHDRQYYMALGGSQVNFIVIKPKFSGPPSFSSSIKNDRSIT